MKGPRTIFIGDVHGCLSELRLLLSRLNLSQEDQVVLTGDLINRGPDSAGVVYEVYERGYACVMGNHEWEYLKNYLTSEKYARLRTELGELHRFIAELPLHLQLGQHLVVHAGLAPGKTPAETRPEILLNIRTWDGKGEVLNHPAHPPWHNFLTGPQRVVYGHWARQGLHMTQFSIGLDSGCVYGRQLSAYIAEEDQIVQVEARRQYYVPPDLRR